MCQDDFYQAVKLRKVRNTGYHWTTEEHKCQLRGVNWNLTCVDLMAVKEKHPTHFSLTPEVSNEIFKAFSFTSHY